MNIDLKKYKKLRFLILGQGADWRRGSDSRETTINYETPERIQSEVNHGVVANLAKIVANIYKDVDCSLKLA